MAEQEPFDGTRPPTGNDLAYWGVQAMNTHQRAASDTLFVDAGKPEQREIAEMTIADILIGLFKSSVNDYPAKELWEVCEAGFNQARKDIDLCRSTPTGWGQPIIYPEDES